MMPSRSAVVIRPCTTRILCRRFKSTTSTPSCHPLKGDEGSLATHVHHKVTTALSLITPLYLVLPTDSSSTLPITIPREVDQAAGIAISGLISVHSWIGLNYVVTDYIPKISKTLMWPARIVSAGMALVTMIGLSKISIQNDSGLRGLVHGLWNPKKKE